MGRFLAFVPFLLLVVARSVAAQPLPTDPRVVTGECDNGLRYVVARHAMPPLRAQVWLSVDAGSLNEAPTQLGAAHFLSHLAFAGSENFPPDSVAPLLESMGMRAGADLNSHSTFTETVYKLSLREATPDAVGKALAFLRDIAVGLTLPPEAIERERAAILAEQKNAATIDQRIQEFLLASLSPGSIIGERLRLGTPQSVSGLTAENLRSFYSRWYVPSNMTVVFVGDMDPTEAVALIRSTIGAGRPAPRPAAPELGLKPQTESRAAVISDAELTAARVYMLKAAPIQPPVARSEDLRRRVLDSLAVGAFNRRLGAKIATGKFTFEESGAFSSDLSGVCQLTGAFVASDAGKWREALGALGVELQRARLHGLYPSEVDETKKQFLAQAEQNVANESTRQATAYAAAINAAVANTDALMSAQQTFDQLRAILDSLDAKAVSDHFTQHMDPAGALFMLAVPSTTAVPTEAEALAAGLAAVGVAPPAEAEYVKPTALMTQRPVPATIVEESVHEATGVWSAWLSNGARLHHRSMDIAPGQVTITVAVAGGLIEETEITRGLTEAGSVAWSRPATSTLPSFAIQELTEGKKIRLGGGPGVDNLLLAISGPVEELEIGMQLLHLLLTDPVIEAPGLDQWKRTQIEQAELRATQPREVFNDAMLDMVYAASETRPRSLTRAQIERVTQEAAQGWIKRQVSTGPLEVSVVGDLPRERAVELVTTYVGSLPARERINSTTLDDKRSTQLPRGPRDERREVAGLTATSFVMAGFRGTDAENLADSRLLGLAAQIINTRLAETLQKKENLIQNVLVQSQPSQEFPGSGVFGAFAPTVSDKAETAVTRMFETFDAFAASGPSVEELAKAKQDVTLQIEAAMADPGFWTGQLSLLDYRGIPLDALASALPAYTPITPDDVRAAFVKYDRPESRMRLVLVQKLEAKPVAPLEKSGPVAPVEPAPKK